MDDEQKIKELDHFKTMFLEAIEQRRQEIWKFQKEIATLETLRLHVRRGDHETTISVPMRERAETVPVGRVSVSPCYLPGDDL